MNEMRLHSNCGIVDALVNMVASQSEDNRRAIIQFVTSEMRKSQTSFT